MGRPEGAQPQPADNQFGWTLDFEVSPRLPYNHGVSELFTRPIDATTRYCAVYGHPIAHSASPAIQNAGMAALGLNWRYLAFDVRPDDLREAIAGAQAMKFIGLNLTVPHKLLALEMVNILDESARTWGAVNTIRFEGKDRTGSWFPLHSVPEPKEIRSHGFNTDAEAISQSVREELALKLANAKVLLLGAGGAGRVAALKLAAEGISELYLVNRTLHKAEALRLEIQNRSPQVRVTVGCPTAPIDLVVNATSLGLKPEDEFPFDKQKFPLSRAEAVFDMIYRPAETPLLQQAKAAGCRVANGLGMLLRQGAKALEIWTGQPAPVPEMRAALQKHIYG